MDNQTKTCPRCKINKSAGDFNKSTRNSDGLQTYCRECRRKMYQADAPRILEKQRAHYEANLEQERAYMNQLNAVNRHKVNARQNARYHKHSELINAERRAHYAETAKTPRVAAQAGTRARVATNLRAKAGRRTYRRYPAPSNK